MVIFLHKDTRDRMICLKCLEHLRIAYRQLVLKKGLAAHILFLGQQKKCSGLFIFFKPKHKNPRT